MLETLNSIDTQILLFINGLHCEFFDNFMRLFTGRFVWIPMYAFIILVLFKKFDWRRASIYVVAIALSIAIADQVCATLIRPVVERLRPSNPDNPISGFVHIVNGYRAGRYGFPSCHGANSFALATILCLMIRRWRFSVFIFVWAILNSYSRIYLGVHYPGDILVGALIGIGGAYISYRFAIMACNRFISGESTDSRGHIAIPSGISIENSAIHISTVTIRVSDVMIASGCVTVLVMALLSL